MAADELLTSEFQFTLALFQISLIAVITAGVGCIIVKIYQYLKAEGLLGGKKDTGDYPDAFIRLIQWFYHTHATGCILMLVMHGNWIGQMLAKRGRKWKTHSQTHTYTDIQIYTIHTNIYLYKYQICI